MHRRRDFWPVSVGAGWKMSKNRRAPKALVFEECHGLRHGFFSRHESDQEVAAFFTIPLERLLIPEQIHSARAFAVQECWGKSPQVADGLVTDRAGLALAVSTADCAPVLLADVDAGVVAALHAGWRGALEGICEAGLAAMERLGARRSRVRTVIGPCISQSCYEVDESFRKAFVRAGEHDRSDRFFRATNRNDRWHFNLPGYVASRLVDSGVAMVGNMGNCTYTNETMYHSYRRGVHRGQLESGRQISAVMLEES